MFLATYASFLAAQCLIKEDKAITKTMKANYLLNEDFKNIICNKSLIQRHVNTITDTTIEIIYLLLESYLCNLAVNIVCCLIYS